MSAWALRQLIAKGYLRSVTLPGINRLLVDRDDLDTHYSVNQVLGERFLLYRFAPAEEVRVARQAMSQQGLEGVMREEMREAVAAFFRDLVPLRVPISETILDRLAALDAFTARARSGVVWDYRPATSRPSRGAHAATAGRTSRCG